MTSFLHTGVCLELSKNSSRFCADVIVRLEDDTAPSPDALRQFDWAVNDLLIPDVKSSDGHQIQLASGCNKPKSEPRTEQSHSCQSRPIWSPWGWAVDRRRLAWRIANWCTRNRKCFTCQFESKYRRTRHKVFPLLSRIQNIGYDLDEYGRTPEWYRSHHRKPWVAGNECSVGNRL